MYAGALSVFVTIHCPYFFFFLFFAVNCLSFFFKKAGNITKLFSCPIQFSSGVIRIHRWITREEANCKNSRQNFFIAFLAQPSIPRLIDYCCPLIVLA